MPIGFIIVIFISLSIVNGFNRLSSVLNKVAVEASKKQRNKKSIIIGEIIGLLILFGLAYLYLRIYKINQFWSWIFVFMSLIISDFFVILLERLRKKFRNAPSIFSKTIKLEISIKKWFSKRKNCYFISRTKLFLIELFNLSVFGVILLYFYRPILLLIKIYKCSEYVFFIILPISLSFWSYFHFEFSYSENWIFVNGVKIRFNKEEVINTRRRIIYILIIIMAFSQTYKIYETIANINSHQNDFWYKFFYIGFTLYIAFEMFLNNKREDYLKFKDEVSKRNYP